MSPFEHVTALLSFVYALALTHLLARIAELIVARDRVKFSGLLAVGMVNAVVLVFSNWLSIWDLRSLKTWDLVSITIQFLFAVAIYIICALIGPTIPDEGFLNLEDFFWRQRRYFYGTVVLCVFLSLIANVAFLKTTNASLFLKENSLNIPMFIPTVLGLLSDKRWAQWAAGLGFLAMMLAYTIIFCSQLS
ncbi:MAG TPA: hypothetical protein VJ721_02140 [Chthoniobacterales bacterium]|nr:hypothetical protein [Chthoniobacterales bacterium]